MKSKYEKASSFDAKTNPFKNLHEDEDDTYPTIEEWQAMESKDQLAFLHD